MRPAAAGLGIGVVFGVVMAWSGMASPVVLHEALLFQHAYLFLMFASAVFVASIGVRLLRRSGVRATFTGGPVSWVTETPTRRHIAGSLVFGLGWGISDACPGPVAAQIGQGIGWAVFTLAGVLTGVYVFLRLQQPETEPPSDTVPARGRPAPALR